jgi:ATP-dependent Clp protease protease subunit
MMDDPKNILDGNRIIYMGGEFNEPKAEMIISKLLSFECINPSKDILLLIDSYGGMLDSFISIHDTMKLLRCNVATCCIGKAMSCGQALLVRGATGKRFITPNSRVMIHELSCIGMGKLTELETMVSENQRMQNLMDDLTVKYTKLTKKSLATMKGRDTFLNAKECKDNGFVDHIITSPSVLYKNLNT